MNRKILPLFWLGLAMLLLSIAGCGKGPSKDDKVLVTVGNRRITVSDLKQRLAKVPAAYRNVIDNNKERFLDDTIAEMVFYEEAVRKGLDKDREIREILNEAKKKIVIAKLIKNEVDDKLAVQEEEMRRFYENHKDDFRTEEMWRASHILVPTEKEAKEILDEIATGANFEEIAKVKSIDATATRGGDVGFFRKGQVVPEFERVCLNLNKGETSGVIHTQFGYHIIKLTDKKEPATEEFEKVKGAIAGALKRAKRSVLFEEFIANLRKKYDVRTEKGASESLKNLNN